MTRTGQASECEEPDGSREGLEEHYGGGNRVVWQPGAGHRGLGAADVGWPWADTAIVSERL